MRRFAVTALCLVAGAAFAQVALAQVKISALPNASNPPASVQVPCVTSGVTYNCTATQLQTAASGLSTTGDASQTTVVASGGNGTVTALNKRFGAMLNGASDFGMVADATGSPGVGTDNSTALQAIGNSGFKTVYIPPGNYRFASTISLTTGVTIKCGGRRNTFLTFDDSTGIKDGFYINGQNSVRIEGCQIIRAQDATAGALIHSYNSSFIWIVDNQIGIPSASDYRSYDNVKIECNASSSAYQIEYYFIENEIDGASNDDVNLSCASTTASMADIFFETRNYLRYAENAAIEINGNVGWTHIDDTDFDNNPGTGLIVNGSTNSGINQYLDVNNSHFELNGYAASFTSYSNILYYANTVLGNGGSITCTLCAMIGGLNNYKSTAAITINGGSFIDTGSQYATVSSGLSGMIIVGPNGTTASSNIDIKGANFPFTYIPFVYFTGSSYPATNVNLSVNSLQGNCFGGTNVTASSFTYECQSAGANGYIAVKTLSGNINARGFGPQQTFTVSQLTGFLGCNAANLGQQVFVTDLSSPTYNGTLTGGGNTARWVQCSSVSGSYYWKS